METKKNSEEPKKRAVNARIPQDLLDYVKSQWDSQTSDIINAIGRLRAIRRSSLGEIKRLFTKDEWMFFIDSMNGTMADDMFCCNVGALIAHCEDAELYEGTATKYKVDMKSLCEKINTLHGANIEAIYYRVSQFWDNTDKYKLEEYVDF